MDILVIGDANHQYNLSFCKWIKKSANCSVSIIDFKSSKIQKGDYDSFYPLGGNPKLLNIKWFGSIYRAFLVKRIIKKNKLGNEVVLLQSAIPWTAIISRFLKNHSHNFTIALWGSDFYRYKKRRILEKLISNANNIIIGSPQMITDFDNEFGKLNLKVNLCYFGNEPMENLKTLKDKNITKKESCDALGLDNNYIKVIIGHNGSIHNKHLEVIESITQSNPEQNYHVILPMTYGANKEYINEVFNKCKVSLKKFTILTDFMSEQEVAHLRNISDIMINVQTTDAFSGSMREVMFCGGVMINGAWLPYDFLTKRGVYFETVDNTEGVGNKIDQIILDFDVFSEKARKNREKIYELSSWSKTIKAWSKVLISK
tara:strand:+ start:3964 stop:5079 length:1116 start_codon:yes stop_codon:yes gene_type:complete